MTRSMFAPYVAAILGILHFGCSNVPVIAEDVPGVTAPRLLAGQNVRHFLILRRKGGTGWIAEGFAPRAYRTIVVDRFVVTASNVDENDRETALSIPTFLQRALVHRLREARLFERVVDLGMSPVLAEPSGTLRLEGTIKVLSGGSRALLDFGTRRSNLQVEMWFFSASSGRTMLITDDARTAVRSAAAPAHWEGNGEQFLQASASGIVRDVVSWLVRLAASSDPHRSETRGPGGQQRNEASEPDPY